MEAFVVRHILPKLAYCIQTMAINPHNQDISKRAGECLAIVSFPKIDRNHDLNFYTTCMYYGIDPPNVNFTNMTCFLRVLQFYN